MPRASGYLYDRRQRELGKIMTIIGKTYMPDSGVYQMVLKGLKKLSLYELEGLIAMIETSK